MTYKDIVTKLSGNATKADMEKLTDLTSAFLETVSGADKLIMRIDMELNPLFTRETAECAVSKMRNEDGTIGAHWNYETATSVLHDKGWSFHPCDWYYVLNMVYSDYYDDEADNEYYFKLAADFLKDKDAPAGKAKKYYLAMRGEK